MKILLLQTGGTIGSEEKNGVIDASGGVEDTVKKQNDVIITTERVYNILSENLTPAYSEKLIRRISHALQEDYDGIIVTHGSDTLSYTSALLGLCFGAAGKPIVITAANYVPSDPRSNAMVNMNTAAELVRVSKCGVYTVYKNDNSDLAQVWLPTRLIEADRFFDRFSSRDGHELALYDGNGSFIFHSDSADGFSLCGKNIDCSSLRFEKKVLVINANPAADYNSINIPEGTAALLHESDHSGTINSSASTLLKKCRERKIPFFICSVKKSAVSLYESTHSLISDGAIPLYDITTEAALAKLMLAVNLPGTDVQSFMNDNIYFE